MRNNFISVGLTAILMCLLTHGCAEEAKVTPAFQIGESTQRINHFRDDVYWLDNNTLVFVGAHSGPIKKGEPSAFPDAMASIHVWRIGDEPIPYKLGVWPQKGTQISENYVCAADGKIIYSTRAYEPALTGFEVPVMEGSPGNEAPSLFRYRRSDPEWSRPGVYNVVGKRCDQVHFARMKERKWQVSYLRDQVLDMGPSVPYQGWQPRPIQIPVAAAFSLIDVHSKEVRPVIGIDPHWATPECAQPLSWERAFVIWACSAGSIEREVAAFPIWKIRSDGYVERSDAHLGNLVAPQLVPFRDGYLFVSWGRYDTDGEGAEGIYLLDGGQPRKIAHGAYRAKAMSPNGCLGAFSNSVQFEAGGVFDRLTVFDFCKMRGRSP